MTGPGSELLRRRQIVEACRSCGSCKSVCPIFAEVGIESAVARGKVALIRAVLDGDIDLSEAFDERMQLCLNCKACVADCPNEVRVDDLILAARSGLVESGRLPFLKRLIFRQLLRRGRLLPPVGRAASFFQRVVLRGLPKESAVRRLLPMAGIDRHRTFPEFAPRSLLKSVPEIIEAKGPKRASGGSQGDVAEAGSDERRRIAREARSVAFFVGCATNLIYPETGKAVIDALTRAGVDVVVPRGQGCCGTPVFNAGDFVTARELARKNIEALRATSAEAIVTGCASCGLTLKREYEETLGFTDGIGMPVYDFTEFLAYRGNLPVREARPERIRVTYHDPCHLSRGQGITDEPREVLRSLPWIEFVEMRDADRCCGGGGSFCLTHYDLARAIGERKVEAIREAGVDVVATECLVCIMHLRDMVARAGLDVAVVSVADLLAQRPGS